MLYFVHSSLIYNSQNLERTQMSFNRGMNTRTCGTFIQWMDRTRKYHPEWGNPIAKEYTWYALTGKCILAPKLQITRIQFTDHMKLKKKEDQSVGASVLLRKGNKTLMGKIWRQNVEQRLSHLVHHIYSHQTQTLLWMPRNACWKEPDIAVSWKALPEPYKYRGRCSQTTAGLSPRWRS